MKQTKMYKYCLMIVRTCVSFWNLALVAIRHGSITVRAWSDIGALLSTCPFGSSQSYVVWIFFDSCNSKSDSDGGKCIYLPFILNCSRKNIFILFQARLIRYRENFLRNSFLLRIKSVLGDQKNRPCFGGFLFKHTGFKSWSEAFLVKINKDILLFD